jgi:hypothetical protein
MSLSRSTVISIVLRVMGYLGLVVVFLGSIFIAGKLRRYAGGFPVFAMAIGFGAAWAATPESRAMAERVKRALLDLGWSLKEAAIRIEMDIAQLSRQLGGVEQMSLSRYAAWGDEFWFQFSKRGIEERGGLVVTHAELAGTLIELQQQLSGASGRWKGAA